MPLLCLRYTTIVSHFGPRYGKEKDGGGEGGESHDTLTYTNKTHSSLITQTVFTHVYYRAHLNPHSSTRFPSLSHNPLLAPPSLHSTSGNPPEHHSPPPLTGWRSGALFRLGLPS